MQVTGFSTLTRSGRGRSSCNFDRDRQLASGKTVMNACQRPVVAVKIPEVDEMLQRAQDKVDAIRRVQIRTAGPVR